jgi:hypothetical protein
MTLVTRMILASTLIVMLAQGVSAQQPAPVGEPAGEKPAAVAGTTTTASEEGAATFASNSEETRMEFATQLRRLPPELATILTLDPTLLSNEAFLTGYPQLASFVAAHPEVRRNPRFYLSEFQPSLRRSSVLDDILEGVAIFGTMSLIAFALGWLVRTIIEQKRWNRLSRTQSEVHNKILDRFGATDELLAYIRSPAGSKFLESAPIPLRAEQATPNAPVARVMWSIQFGVVILAAAIGMLVVANRFDAETAGGFMAIGGIAFCIGVGFVASAAISLILSRRLGLWPSSSSTQIRAVDDEGPVG